MSRLTQTGLVYSPRLWGLGMDRSEHEFPGFSRASFRGAFRNVLLLVLLAYGSKPCETLQTSSTSERCWPAEMPMFPAGSRDKVLKQSADFLIQVESIPTHPYWPGGNSGISIGVGWDLGQHGESELRGVWSGLGAATLTKLSVAAMKTGKAAQSLLQDVKSIEIPRNISAAVLEESLREVYYPMILRLLPGAQLLPTEFQVVLLSVVFNRGVALGHDPDWRTAKALDTRWEMRKLQGDVARGDLFAIYIRLGTMKRIWENDPEQRGLPIRRKDEQHLVRPYVDKVLEWEQRRDDLKATGLPPCSKASAEE